MDLFAHAPVREGDVLAKKYRVEKVLGMGGMGIVVAARHVELDQPVALKFLLPTAVDSEEMVTRFVNEGRAVVRLKSEHVTKVLDVGRLDDGAPYIVMELLSGQDLGQVMRERSALAIEDAASFVLQACEAVGEAHSVKIIHRDLKPQNLFLTTGLDGEPLIKVLDFGISKSLTPTSTDGGAVAMTLTRTQSMLGSPLYMSPEQMRSSKRVDERSDIWSFGVILFELVTGRVPFEAENVPELVFKIAENDVPNPKDLRPDLPEGLVRVILHCLQKDADKRYANLSELANDLEPFASPRDRGIASRVGVMLGTQARPRAMSFSDISSAKATPAVAVSDAWGATHAAPVPLSKKKEPGGNRMASIALGVVALLAVGGIAFGVTSKLSGARAPTAPAAGTGGGLAGTSSTGPAGTGSTGSSASVSVGAASASSTVPSPSAAPSSPTAAASSVAARGNASPSGRAPRGASGSSQSAAAPINSALAAPVTSLGTSTSSNAAPSTSARGGFIPVRE